MTYWEEDNERLKSFREWFAKPSEMAVFAALYLEPEILQQLKRDKQFDTLLLNNIRGCPVETMFPIQNITKCWDLILRPDAFAEDLRDMVKWLRERNNLVKDFYRYWGINVEKLSIPYRECFDGYLTYFFEDELDDYIIEQSLEKHAADGTREIDVRLFIECMRMNIPEVKKLLAEGANMGAIIYDGERSMRLDQELRAESSKASGQIFKYLQKYWEDPEDGPTNFMEEFTFPYFVAWAGYEDVIQVLMAHNA